MLSVIKMHSKYPFGGYSGFIRTKITRFLPLAHATDFIVVKYGRNSGFAAFVGVFNPLAIRILAPNITSTTLRPIQSIFQERLPFFFLPCRFHLLPLLLSVQAVMDVLTNVGL